MTPAGMDPYVESTYDPYSLPDPFNPREKINKEILDELLNKLEMKIHLLEDFRHAPLSKIRERMEGWWKAVYQN